VQHTQLAKHGRGTGPGTAAHWEAQPLVVAQGAAAALRTRPLPQPTASSLVVESFCFAKHACTGELNRRRVELSAGTWAWLHSPRTLKGT
jgi:hypothetical protein